MGKRGIAPTPLADRFWPKVSRADGDGCWEWTAALFRTGYGEINSGGWHGKALYAHRVAWELTNGPIPVGLEVCHKCDNRRCVRPSHLFLGTRADNIRDAAQKGRLAHGTRLPHTRLTELEVTEIRVRYAAGGISQASLAREYGVSQMAVSQVVRRVSWSRVT